MTRQISLSVNDDPITLDYFVAGFLDHTAGGRVAALEGTGDIGTVSLSIDDGGQVAVNLNNAQGPLNIFASKIIRNTMVGMVSTLKGVGEIKTLELSITR